MLGEYLYTRRLVMRRIVEADLPLILAWSNSETAFGPYLTPERLSARSLKEQFDGSALWNRGNKTYLIEDRRSTQPIGTIHYWIGSNQPDTASICVKIAEPAQRRKGYGTEAQKFLIIHLFEQASVKTVEMYTDINNLPQQRCLSKLGFSLVDSLTYEDRQVFRTGFLFQLSHAVYLEKAIYRFHYE